jgi:F-type H+-transporting ATPase subunit b
MQEFLKRSALALALLVGLAAPATVRAAEEHTTTSTETHHGVEAAGPGEHAERPLLDFQPAEAVWIVIIFSILLIVLYKTAWKNVLGGLKAREERIRKDITEAEAARAKSESALKDYNAQLATAEQKVREMIQVATTEGERISTQIKMQAQQEAEAARERSVKEIETAKKQAIQEIYAEAANLSTSIAEKILRRNLNADDQRDLVNRSLEQLQTVGTN